MSLDVRVRDLFNDNLTRIRHERDDIHYIGEALPAPSLITSTLSSGTPAFVGGSSVPAREDHVHALDIADLETTIQTLITEGSTTLVNESEVINLINIYGGGVGGPNDFAWSYADLIVDPSVESFGDIWIPPDAGNIVEFYVTATSASAAGSYIIKLYIGGVEYQSLTLLAGEVAISSGTISDAITGASQVTVSVQKSGSFTGDLEGLLAVAVYEYV